MFRKIILLFFFLGSTINLQASHLIGGEINWECAGNGQYIFTLTLYRDCNGAALPAGIQGLLGPNGYINCNFIAGSSGALAYYSGTTNCIIEKGVYRSGPVILMGTPPANGWEFSWNTCCRSQYENANGGSALYLRSKMYPFTPIGSSIPSNTNPCYDNSPSFLQDTGVIATQGKFNYNQQAVDQDQDSLSIVFARPLDGANTSASFNSGYSFTSPFPDSTENLINGSNRLDPHSGILSIETYGASSGFYQNCVVARSFRNGQLIAEVYRELPLYIDGSNQTISNNAPQIEIDTVQFPNLHRTGNTYRITAMNNDSIDILINVNDIDFNANASFQTFCLNANGSKINSRNLVLDSNCQGGGPCATIDTLANGSHCSSVSQTYRFQWHAQCQLLSNGILGRTTYIFHIMATDNANPYSKSGNLSLLVDLYPSRLNGPNFSITGGNTNGDLDFAWSPYNAQLDAPFQKYQIYGNGGPGTAFTLLDSISDRSITSVSLSGLNYPAEFYINQVTGSCSAVSNNSDTISSTVILSQIELSNHSIVIYPQPAEDFIILESGSKSLQLNQAKLYDIRGNLLQQFDFNSLAKQEKIMLDQAAGMYILDLGTAEGPVRKRIIIK